MLRSASPTGLRYAVALFAEVLSSSRTARRSRSRQCKTSSAKSRRPIGAAVSWITFAIDVLIVSSLTPASLNVSDQQSSTHKTVTASREKKMNTRGARY